MFSYSPDKNINAPLTNKTLQPRRIVAKYVRLWISLFPDELDKRLKPKRLRRET